MKKSLFITIFFMLFSVLTGCTNNQTNTLPIAKNGSVNLQKFDFSHGAMVKLDGEWEFYWNQLHTPKDFLHKKNISTTNLINVPIHWNKAEIEGHKLTGNGYATYRLHLKLNKKLEGQLMGIYIPFGVESAYTVYVNGKKLTTAGQVGKSKEEMVGQYYPKVAMFSAKQENEIIIQVSNFVQRTGGMWDPIRLGTSEDMVHFWNGRLAKELFVAGSIIIMGIYHLGLYFIRRKDPTPLYFGMFCLAMGIRSLFLGEVYINHMFPSLNFDIYKKIEYLGQYIGPMMFILYVQSLYPKEINRKMVKLLVIFDIIFSLITLLTPATIFTYTLSLSQLTLAIYAPYVVYVFILAALRKREGALVSCIMFFVMALTIINDLLYYNNIISTFDMAKFGLFIFIFAQAFLLTIKFSKAFKSVEELSKRQEKWSLELEKTVTERTQDLQKTLEDLKMAQKQLVESEKMAALGALVAGVAHEINTPVGISVTATTHLELKTNETIHLLENNKMKKSDLTNYLNLAKESTHIISNNLQRASDLVKSFKLVAVDQSSEALREFNLTEYIHEIIVSLGPNLKRGKHEVIVNAPDSLMLTSYPGVFSQIFTNLIMNSIIHGFSKEQHGLITIDVHTSPYLKIVYTDNGKGMSREVKEKVFDPFFTTNRANGGTGLGMHIVFNLVTQTLGGTIDCISSPGEGTEFIIHLRQGEECEK